MKFRLTLPMPLLAAAALCGIAHGQAGPRILPAQDAMGVYRVSQPGHADQVWRVRYRAAGRMLRAVGTSGQASGLTVLLDLVSGSADVVLPQMHAVVGVPGLSGLIHKLLDRNGAHFTRLGQAVIAGQACTRYLILEPKGDGSACITGDGIVLEATGKDDRGAVTVTALRIARGPQPAADFVPPQGYSSISLPPSMLAQLLGG